MKITDFGISKRWVGTSLKTQCGTAIYRSPEQLGILPREFRAGNSYTNNIDIWALGVIVHEMLTLKIPFLDTDANADSGFTSCLSIVEDMVDTGLLYGYCHGANPFPCGSLRSHGVPEDGIEFVKHLMAVNPSERLSAAAALANEWLVSKDPMCGPASSEPVLPALPPVAGFPGSPKPSLTKDEVERIIVSSPDSTEPRPATTDEPEAPVVDCLQLPKLPTTVKEEKDPGIDSTPEIAPCPSQATGQIYGLIECGSNEGVTSVQANDPPLAHAAEFPLDQEDETTEERGSPGDGIQGSSLRRSGSWNTILSSSSLGESISSNSAQPGISQTKYKRSGWRFELGRRASSGLSLTSPALPASLGPSRPFGWLVSRQKPPPLIQQYGSTKGDGEQLSSSHSDFVDYITRDYQDTTAKQSSTNPSPNMLQGETECKSTADTASSNNTERQKYGEIKSTTGVSDYAPGRPYSPWRLPQPDTRSIEPAQMALILHAPPESLATNPQTSISYSASHAPLAYDTIEEPEKYGEVGNASRADRPPEGPHRQSAGTPLSDRTNEYGRSGSLGIIRHADAVVVPSSADLLDTFQVDVSQGEYAQSSFAEPLPDVPPHNGLSTHRKRMLPIKWVQIPSPPGAHNHRVSYDAAMAKPNSPLLTPDFRHQHSRSVSPGRSPQLGDFVNPRPPPGKPPSGPGVAYTGGPPPSGDFLQTWRSPGPPSPHARGVSPERPARWGEFVGGLLKKFGK